MSDIFDKIAASTPLNKTAATVTSRGQAYTPAVKPRCAHWETPPPMRQFQKNGSPTLVDLTGRKFGRFTVIGLLDAPPKGDGEFRWVCRCACGRYEPRVSKAINRLQRPGDEDRCTVCAHTKRLIWHGQQRRTVEDAVRDLTGKP